MGWEAWVTVALTALMVVAMARNLAGPDAILLGGLTLLTTLGIVPLDRAFAGFANEGVLTVAVLFVVAAGVRDTGGLDALMRRVLGRPRSLAGAQLRMMVPVSAASAFLNNTPLVAMMVPVVTDWARRNGLAASRLLIPLSYASILGGTCTLIGTSTNLVVYGLARQHAPELDIGMFDITVLGVPVLLVGIAYIVLTSRALLPDRTGSHELIENPREYTVAMRVEPDSPVVGKSIEEAGLRHLPGLYLVEIERDGELMPAVDPETHLRAGDHLLFVGIVESVVDLRRIRGLVPATDQVEKLSAPSPSRRLLEAVVGAGSALAGKNVRELAFRTRYEAAIIAVHRNGERVGGKVGDIVLRAGDVLLLEAPPSFLRRHKNDSNFALVTEVEGSAPMQHAKAPIALGLMVAMIVLSATGVLPLLVAGLLAAGGMLVTGCLSGAEARRALELRVLIAIAASFGVGEALESSGAAAQIGGALVDVAAPFGPVAALAGIYLATALLTELITNNAAAALMFPLAAAAGDAAQLPLLAVALVVMMAASASFSTPIGYQTNLMVYGPGGYRFGDFLRFGIPLQVTLAIVTISIASFWFL
ncbi:MAG TPA: SLC13 family permease [Sandaracinaceae bacterium]